MASIARGAALLRRETWRVQESCGSRSRVWIAILPTLNRHAGGRELVVAPQRQRRRRRSARAAVIIPRRTARSAAPSGPTAFTPLAESSRAIRTRAVCSCVSATTGQSSRRLNANRQVTVTDTGDQVARNVRQRRRRSALRTLGGRRPAVHISRRGRPPFQPRDADSRRRLRPIEHPPILQSQIDIAVNRLLPGRGQEAVFRHQEAMPWCSRLQPASRCRASSSSGTDEKGMGLFFVTRGRRTMEPPRSHAHGRQRRRRRRLPSHRRGDDPGGDRRRRDPRSASCTSLDADYGLRQVQPLHTTSHRVVKTKPAAWREHERMAQDDDADAAAADGESDGEGEGPRRRRRPTTE